MSAAAVTICEVGPRDGLQNEPVVLAPAVRSELCTRLAATGLRRIEAVSFVSDRHVPAMAGAEEVVAGLDLTDGIAWSGLCLNERGFERALAAGLSEVNYTLAATEVFCRRNQGRPRADAEALLPHIAERARELGARLTVTIAVAFGCPFEGRVPPSDVLAVANRAATAGADRLVLADTVGVAVPPAVGALVGSAAALGIPLGAHFHDTRRTGLANAVAALDAGVTALDASIGGTGGCPFAPGATGNVATEDVVYMLEEMGQDTGVDLDALIACSEWLAGRLGHRLAGGVTNAGGFPR